MRSTTDLIIREAILPDIPGIQRVRHAVKENRLSDPSLVPDKDVEDYMFNRGKGWVCVADEKIIGFAIVSVQDKNVWALFVDPAVEKKGIGRLLHDRMMDWYFTRSRETVWLSTAKGTRAEQFYQSAGWTPAGDYGTVEIKFEMSYDSWNNQQKHNS